MKKAVIAGCMLAGLVVGESGSAFANDTPSETPDARTQLDVRKQQYTADFDAQERACSRTFAVNDCVNEVNVRRRATMAVLRKDENRLNAEDRRQRERERLKSLQEKTAQRAQQVPPVVNEVDSTEERLRRQQDKVARHAPQSAPKAPVSPAASPALDTSTREKNAAEYAARQKAASERKAAREKKLKEQIKVQPDLPTPP